MFKKFLCGLMLIASSSMANAALINQSATITQQSTNFATNLVFDLFDLGPEFDLTKISFSIDGDVFGTANVESLDATASTINISLAVTLTLFDLTNSPLVISIPLFAQQFNATAFDGVIDFGGTSGATFANLNASQGVTEEYTDAATLSAFTGPGTITLGFTAAGSSSANGAGNIVTQFATQASGDVSIVYEYQSAEVAEPSLIALFGLGLIAVGGIRRSKK
ncbi:hypothetical protein D210916BOD24_19020 [Alteromonas sp. D210916BOD_24]|uniref:PEP-CTERM sorting domain-containing protein n=1 Tax=Alteromonas sp. D210916BOD_24 TaxID=3157618 RepID=UPI00399C78E0